MSIVYANAAIVSTIPILSAVQYADTHAIQQKKKHEAKLETP